MFGNTMLVTNRQSSKKKRHPNRNSTCNRDKIRFFPQLFNRFYRFNACIYRTGRCVCARRQHGFGEGVLKANLHENSYVEPTLNSMKNIGMMNEKSNRNNPLAGQS